MMRRRSTKSNLSKRTQNTDQLIKTLEELKALITKIIDKKGVYLQKTNLQDYSSEYDQDITNKKLQYEESKEKLNKIKRFRHPIDWHKASKQTENLKKEISDKENEYNWLGWTKMLTKTRDRIDETIEQAKQPENNKTALIYSPNATPKGQMGKSIFHTITKYDIDNLKLIVKEADKPSYEKQISKLVEKIQSQSNRFFQEHKRKITKKENVDKILEEKAKEQEQEQKQNNKPKARAKQQNKKPRNTKNRHNAKPPKRLKNLSHTKANRQAILDDQLELSSISQAVLSNNSDSHGSKHSRKDSSTQTPRGHRSTPLDNTENSNKNTPRKNNSRSSCNISFCGF